MKVLFVSRKILFFEVSPLIKNQGESLRKQGVSVDFFTVDGKGISGYLRSITRLRKQLKNKYDIIHSHYSLSSFVASLAGAKPLVVSLMGSDVNSNSFYRFIIRIIAKLFWSVTIVKSKSMREKLNFQKVQVIPNGLDFDRFRPLEKLSCLNKTGWDPGKKHILFAANPNRPVKNFELAQKVIKLIKDKNIQLHYLDHIPNDQMPFYYNASDTVLLTSFSEGSPNVIKEAMACNIPIVSTDVGDVREMIKDTSGCFIVSYNPKEISDKLMVSVSHGKTNGRDKIRNLSSDKIADRIISIYNQVIEKRKY